MLHKLVGRMKGWAAGAAARGEYVTAWTRMWAHAIAGWARRVWAAAKPAPFFERAIEVHVVEWPSGREQGVYWVDPTPGDKCVIYAYGVTKRVAHYRDSAKGYPTKPIRADRRGHDGTHQPRRRAVASGRAVANGR